MTNLDTDAMFRQYIATALWSSTDTLPGDEEPTPLDDWATVDDFAPEALATLRAEFDAFVAAEYDDEARIYWDSEQFAHDFWLTRNGHGTGFWDRYYSCGEGRSVGDRLTAAARAHGEVGLYIGDDRRIYCQ